MSTTLPKQQDYWEGTLTRQCSSTETGSIYVTSNSDLELTGVFYVAIDAGNAKREIFKISNISGTSAEYTCTIGARGLKFFGTDTEDTARKSPHRVGARVIITNNHHTMEAFIAAFQAHEDLVDSFHGVAGIGTTASRPDATTVSGKVYISTDDLSIQISNGTSWEPMFGIAGVGITASRPAAVDFPGFIYFSTDDLLAYYSDGSAWNANAAGTQPKASDATNGITKLSTAPDDAENPISVGDNDPRMLTEVEKTDLTDSGDTTLHHHAADRARANHTGTQSSSTIQETGTAGETLAAGNWVYKKIADGKLYKATHDVSSQAEAWNVAGVIITGGSVDEEVKYQPLSGIYTTTGLTSGTTYYLGTAGALVASTPNTSSGTIIPLKIGVAISSTELSISPQRIQRVKMANESISTATHTVSVGFNIGHVEAFMYYSSFAASGAAASGSGIWNQAQSFQRIGRVGSVGGAITGIIGGVSDPGGSTKSYSASQSGTDLLLTTANGADSYSWGVTFTIYERL